MYPLFLGMIRLRIDIGVLSVDINTQQTSSTADRLFDVGLVAHFSPLSHSQDDKYLYR